MNFNLEILSKSKTPYDYKHLKGKNTSALKTGEIDNSELKTKFFNYMLLDNLTENKSDCVKSFCIPIKNIPNENHNSVESKNYIKQYKTKAYKSGKYAISPNEFKETKIKVANWVRRNQLLIPEIFKNGEYQKKVELPFNIETGNFLKKITKNQKAVCNIEIELDFYKKVDNTGYAIVIFNEKDINPEKVIYKMYENGLDIISGVFIEAFKKKYSLDSFQVYILAVENNYSSNSAMYKLNTVSTDLGMETFKKRIKTIYSSYEMNNFFGYQKNSNPIKLTVNQTLIKKRENNESW